MKLPQVIKLRLPPFMDAGDVGFGVILAAMAVVVLLVGAAGAGLAWTVFKLAGGL